MADKLTTELDKVIRLNAAIKEKNLKRVREIFANSEVPAFTAAALANACCYGGPEIVRFLLEHGASFQSASLPHGLPDSEWGIAYLWCDFFPMPEDRELRRPEHSTLCAEERTEVIRLLETYGCAWIFPEILLSAIFAVDRTVAEVLLTSGYGSIRPNAQVIFSGAEEASDVDPVLKKSYTEIAVYWILHASNERLAWMIRTIVRCRGVSRFAFRKADLYTEGHFRHRFCSNELFDVCLAHTNLAEIARKKDLLAALVQERNSEGLSKALKLGWCRTWAQLDELMEQARTETDSSPEIMAALLEHAGKRKGPRKALSADQDPFAPSRVRRAWSVSTTNGSAELIAYRGFEKDVVVPSRVGERNVTGIRARAFDPRAPRISSEVLEARINLRSVVFPGSIETIPSNLFHYLDSSMSIGRQAPAYACPRKLRKVVLEDGVRTIDEGAFCGLPGLREVEIPKSIRSIGPRAFAYCPELSDVRIPAPFFSLGASAFENSGITRISLPDIEKGISSNAFRHCDKLEEFSAGDETPSIGPAAFFNCSQMHRVKLPAKLESIGNDAFWGCTSLKTLDLPEGLKTIGELAFYISGIERIVIPASVESIGPHAFRECRNLKEVVFLGEHTKVGRYAFAQCKVLRKVSGSPEEISEGAFAECQALEEFDWGEKLEEIGPYAFYADAD